MYYVFFVFIIIIFHRFLLDRGSELSRIAGNTDEGVLELMHMRRALLLSCVVLYARPLPTASISMTETALAHTEHQLATTDALTHLAIHGCHGMMPEVDSLDSNHSYIIFICNEFDELSILIII